MSIQTRKGYKYFTLWVNPQAARFDKRIVVCKPVIDSPTVGIATLKGYNHSDKFGKVFGGEPKNIEAFVNDLERIEKKLSDKADTFIFKFITRLAEKHHLAEAYSQTASH